MIFPVNLLSLSRPAMSTRPAKLLLILLSAYLCPVAFANEQAVDPVHQLSEQGNYWRTHQRSDLAVGVWKKLLALKPDDPEAIWGLGMAEADLQHGDAARAYLASLQRVAPNYEGIASLAERLNVQTPAASAIQDARALARQGRFDDAVSRYRTAFGGAATPPAGMAIEYYETLAGSKSGWEAARSGIEQLAKSNLSDPKVRLSLARILTYHAPTRRDGIERLEALFGDAQVGDAAKQSCHQALLWLDGDPSDAAQFNAYLRVVPDDTAVRDAMTAGAARAAHRAQGDAGSKEPKLGFDALKAGDLDAAAGHFSRALAQNPKDSNALGGMGLVKLRQERFDEATDDLTRASQGSGGARWHDALVSATYWSLVRQAGALRNQGDAGHLAQARSLADRAAGLNVDDVSARVLLADIDARSGNATAAETEYKEVLRQRAWQPDAVRGLVHALVAQGRVHEASALLDSIPEDRVAYISDIHVMRAEIARLAASDAIKRDDSASARAWLEQAVASNPTDPWARLDLGRLELAQGDKAGARLIASQLESLSPATVESVHAAALLEGELGDWERGSRLLERIPVADRSADVVALQRRFAVRAAIRQASALGATDRRAALAILDRASAGAQNDLDATQALAMAYADLGENAQAIAFMRTTFQMKAVNIDDARLAYVALLLKLDRVDDARSWLGQVGHPLTGTRRVTYDSLTVACMVRRADLLRKRGALADAYDAIAPGLHAFPDDADLQAALARLYVAAGNYDEALRHYEQAEQRRGDDPALILESAGAAAAGKRNAYATQALQRAVSMAPSDPQVLADAGRVARSIGETKLATDLLTRSLELDRDVSLNAVGNDDAPDADDKPSAVSNNPFGGKGTSGALLAIALMIGAFSFAPTSSRAGTLQTTAYAQDTDTAATDFAPYRNVQDTEPAQTQRRLTTRNPFASNASDDTDSTGNGVIGASGSGDAGTGTDGSDSAAAAKARRVRVAATERELGSIDAEQASSVSAGIEVRTRQGEDGLSSLTDVEGPLEGKLGFAQGHLVVRATPVTLDAGTADTTTTAPARFGNAGITSTTSPGSQHASGVGLGLGWESRNVSVDVGTTPLQFRESNVVGGVKVQVPVTENTNLTIDASRRAVTDSLLSYAGATDERTGKTWGGVTANGVRAEYGWDDGTNGAYVYGSYHVLRGHDVESNTHSEGGAGLYTRVLKDENQEVTVGVNAMYMHYDKNLGYYTLGQGGYFSPQQFIQASIPVRWDLHTGRMSYEVQGSLGVQHFREDDSPFYPTNAALQAQAVASAANGLTGVYAGQSKTGLGYSFHASAEYQATPQVFFGAYLGFDNARDYTQYLGGMYVRYSMEKLMAGLNSAPQPTESEFLKN